MSWYDRLCDHVGDSLWRVAKQHTGKRLMEIQTNKEEY